MKNTLLLMSFICFGLAAYMCAQSAFVLKKPKKVSSAVIKQEMGESLGLMVKDCNALIGTSAHLQSMAIGKLDQLLSDDVQSFFCKANRQQLEECLSEVEQIVAELHECQTRYAQAVKKFDGLFALHASK